MVITKNGPQERHETQIKLLLEKKGKNKRRYQAVIRKFKWLVSKGLEGYSLAL